MTVTAKFIVAGSGGTGKLFHEYWNNVGGGTIADLTSNANYPNNPSGNNLMTTFDLPVNVGDNYSDRIRGYIYPPTTGAYTFWVAADDAGELRLSTNADPANATRIAYTSGWTNYFDFNASATQKSAAIKLTAGQRYYIEALHVEQGGNDHLTVTWQGPGVPQSVLSGSYISPYVPGTGPTNTPGAVTNTPTKTNTPVVPTLTPTRTFTPVVGASNTPTRTATRTNTPVGPTSTFTRTPTRTNTPAISPTRTNTLTATRTNTASAPTSTPTSGAGACSPVSSTITAPFSFDGAGTFCWQSSNLGGYINSWNTTSVTLNGTNITNLYVASGSYPAKIGGYWYVTYSSNVAWGHFEAK